ncbi:MAG: universal stress protein [Chloroflexota bacterium]|nr:universal stress protein [Chloroflexota bacterium]
MSERSTHSVGTILVPLKGVSGDEEVVRQAALLAKRNRALVYVIYVMVVRQELPLEAEMPEELEKAERILAEAEKIVQVYGVEFESSILQARSAGVAIVEEATERKADLIMMVVTYRSRLGEFNMGRTVPYILKNAPCRVWMFRDELSKIKNNP